jgi:hypothetical protein
VITRFVALAAALLAVFTLSGCSDDEPVASTTTIAAFDPQPPFPVDANAVPFAVGELAALGNVSARVVSVTDPYEDAEADVSNRFVGVDVDVENGALEPVTLEASSFLAYDETGASHTPDESASDPSIFATPLASAATRSGTLVFEVPADTALLFLVFDGEAYGERVLDGIFVLDPDYEPAPGDS